MNIKNEIKKRLQNDEDIYQAIGAEIKSQRLAHSKTLSSIADNNCSISYLCKIERNQIKPNLRYLREICEKVDISEEKMKYLLSSRELLYLVVRKYYFKELAKDTELLDKLEGLDNHRIELIRLIFACSQDELETAKQLINKLMKLTPTLASLDLMLFTTFYGIYLYKIHNYTEAAEYLKLALYYNLSIPYIKPIQEHCLFECAVITHSMNTSKYYLEYQQEILVYGNSLDIESAHYKMAYYYLLEEQFTFYEEIRSKLASQISIKSLDYIYALVSNKKVEKPKMEELDELAQIYYQLENSLDPNLVTKIASANLGGEMKIYLTYLYYKKTNLEQAYEYLIEVAFPQAVALNLGFYANYYLDELAMSVSRPNKYKRFFDMYKELIYVRKLVNQI